MNIKDVHRFFEGRQMPARIMVWRDHNIVLFKVAPENMVEVKRVFSATRPIFMRFLYKELNFWDRFLIRKRKIRMELR